MNIIEKARVFATAAHYAAGNARKYTGEPYINHPTAVVLLVASPENFNAEIGRKVARENAVDKVWPLMGYELRSKLAAA